MLTHNKHIRIYFLLWLCIGFFPLKAQNIELVITNIRSAKGQIVIGIFKDNKSFKDDKPFMRKKFEKTKVSEGKMAVTFSLSPGTYGFALLDDENDDDEMNYSFLGIPQEGFGFSNYYHKGLTRPKFDMFKFVLNKNQNKKVLMKIKYM